MKQERKRNYLFIYSIQPLGMKSPVMSVSHINIFPLSGPLNLSKLDFWDICCNRVDILIGICT